MSLSGVTAEKHKTAEFNCFVRAITIPGWTLFRWLKNGDTIRSNPHKYDVITEIDPYNERSMKSVLTIYDVSKEDKGRYTCIVQYDPHVLQKFGIHKQFSDQVTASLQVN